MSNSGKTLALSVVLSLPQRTDECESISFIGTWLRIYRLQVYVRWKLNQRMRPKDACKTK